MSLHKRTSMAVELINISSGTKQPLEKPTIAPKPKKAKNNDNEPNVETLLNNFVQQGTVFLDTFERTTL